MSTDLENVLLSELQQLRARVDTGFETVATDIRQQAEALARLDVKVTDLVGNGKIGRVEKLEESVAKLEGKESWLSGYTSFIVSASAITLAFVHEKVISILRSIFR